MRSWPKLTRVDLRKIKIKRKCWEKIVSFQINEEKKKRRLNALFTKVGIMSRVGSRDRHTWWRSKNSTWLECLVDFVWQFDGKVNAENVLFYICIREEGGKIQSSYLQKHSSLCFEICIEPTFINHLSFPSSYRIFSRIIYCNIFVY